MNAEVFIDTNLLLYAFSASSGDAEKKAICQDLLRTEGVGISAQVLQEFINNALKKASLGISEESIDVLFELVSEFQVASVSYELMIEAVALRRRYQLSHWDSTIVAAALAMGCSVLYSEDLQDGQNFNGLKVVNPLP